MYTLPYLSEQTIQMLRLWKIIGMHVPLRGRWLPFVSVDQEIWFSDSEGKKQPKQQWQPEKLVNMILRGIKQAKQQILHSFFFWNDKILKNFLSHFSYISASDLKRAVYILLYTMTSIRHYDWKCPICAVFVAAFFLMWREETCAGYLAVWRSQYCRPILPSFSFQ